VVASASETGGDEHRSQLVAIQADRMGLVVELGTAHVNRRRVFDDPFLFGVPVEAGDRAQPSRDRRPRPAVGFQVAGKRFDVGAADLEQSEPVSG
jgi:hypothetical protein